MSLVTVTSGRIDRYQPYTQDLGVMPMRRGDTMHFALGSAAGYLRDADDRLWNFEALTTRIDANVRKSGSSRDELEFSTAVESGIIRDGGRLIFYKNNIAASILEAELLEVDVEATLISGRKLTLYKFKIDLEGDVTRVGSSNETGVNLRQPLLNYPVFERHRLRMADMAYQGDLQPPTVTITPVDGASEVLVNDTVTIGFDETVRQPDNNIVTDNYLTDSAFEFYNNKTKTPVPYSLGTAGGKYLLQPTSALEQDTEYAVTVKNLEDFNNNPIRTTTAIFRTQKIATATPSFTVVPGDNATGVVVDTSISILFTTDPQLADNTPLSTANLTSVIMLMRKSDGQIIPYRVNALRRESGKLVANISPNNTLASVTEYEIKIENLFDANGVRIPVFRSDFITESTQVPGVPPVPRVGTVTDTSAALTYDLVTGATSYRIEYDTDAGFSSPDTLTDNDGAITLSALTPNTDYYVRYVALNGIGESPSPSDTVTFTTSEQIAQAVTLSYYGSALNPPATEQEVLDLTQYVGSGGLQVSVTLRRISGGVLIFVCHTDYRIIGIAQQGFGGNIINGYRTTVVGTHRIYDSQTSGAASGDLTFNITLEKI